LGCKFEDMKDGNLPIWESSFSSTKLLIAIMII